VALAHEVVVALLQGSFLHFYFIFFLFSAPLGLYFGPFLDFSPLNLMMRSSPARSRKKMDHKSGFGKISG
jgi:hypothetical protein